jgi:multidrug efflux pump subunit AcrA (membrane-fusion protein)
MVIRSRRWTSLAASGVLVMTVAACGPVAMPQIQSGADANVSSPGAVPAGNVAQPISVAAPAAANATPTAARRAPKPVAVKRDTVNEVLALDGVTAAQAQEPIMFRWRAVVDDVKVKAGQAVKQNDILIDFSSGDQTKGLADARGALRDAQAALSQAQVDGAARQSAAAQKAASEQKQRESVVIEAEIGLKRAQEDMARVRAGKSALDKQGVDSTVTYYGTTAVAQAQHILDELQAGPSSDTVRAAESDASNAQIALKKAQDDLTTLTRGPDPATLRAAEASLQRAQTQMQIVQASKPDPKVDAALAALQRDAAIQDAQTAVQAAQTQITNLKQPPPEVAVQAARNRVADAEVVLSTAQTKLAALQAGPDQKALDGAIHQLEYAKHALVEAEQLRDEIYSHPTPAELRVAEDQVRSAQRAVDNARQAAAAPPEMAAVDLSGLEQTVQQRQAAVATAERSLDDTHLRAPFDGTVVSVKTRVGDTPTPSLPVVTLARPGPPVVRIELDDAVAPRLSAGLSATVQLGSGEAATPVAATLAKVAQAAADGRTGASAELQVSWPDGALPKFGTPVVVSVLVQQKQNVLVVPKSAVRQSAGRSLVEVQDGSLRKLVPVQVGISATDVVEIISGVTEGQMVLAGPS